MNVTIKDIARMAGVSTSTVSRILNNKVGFISEATQEKVLKIAKEHSYVPNHFARSLVTKKSKIIGIIIPDILNPFFTEMIRGCDDMVQKLGYSMIMLNSDDDKEKEKKHLDYLGQLSVDGIILASGSLTSNLDIINKYKIPFVAVDKIIKENKHCVGVVYSDNRKAAYLATKHLITKGHTKIVFLCGAKNSPSSQERFIGYCAAMNEGNLPIDNNLVYFGEYLHGFGYLITKKLIESNYDFSSICCMSDMLALGAMKALREKRISVPRECAVIGCDDIFLNDLIDCPLSSVKRRPYDMGSRGVEILISYIEQKNQEFVDECLEPILIVRETT